MVFPFINCLVNNFVDSVEILVSETDKNKELLECKQLNQKELNSKNKTCAPQNTQMMGSLFHATRMKKKEEKHTESFAFLISVNIDF